MVVNHRLPTLPLGRRLGLCALFIKAKHGVCPGTDRSICLRVQMMLQLCGVVGFYADVLVLQREDIYPRLLCRQPSRTAIITEPNILLELLGY